MWLFAVLVGWPLAEIALFVLIGGQIGLWVTLAWVVLSTFLGVMILRLSMVQQAMALRDMRSAARLASAGALGMVGGLLLILPGFLTDFLGLLLLLPPVQALVTRAIAARVQVVRAEREEVIDGDYTDVTPRRDGPSGWTRIE